MTLRDLLLGRSEVGIFGHRTGCPSCGQDVIVPLQSRMWSKHTPAWWRRLVMAIPRRAHEMTDAEILVNCPRCAPSER